MRRQPHPELNFRMGRGRLREVRRAQSPEALLATFRALGLSDDEMRAALLRMKKKAEAADE